MIYSRYNYDISYDHYFSDRADYILRIQDSKFKT